MVTEKEIEREGLKAGYAGKITPYVRAQLINRIKERKKNGETIPSKPKPTSKSSTKKSTRKKLKSTAKRIGKGVKKASSYLADCGERFGKMEERSKSKTRKKTSVKRKTTRKKKAGNIEDELMGIM